MHTTNSLQADEIVHVIQEDLARKALMQLLDFAVHTALYADDNLFQCVTAAIEALQRFIGFPLSAGQAIQLYTDLLQLGWKPNAAEWPDQADL